jgi:protoporphyrinogen oxidase
VISSAAITEVAGAVEPRPQAYDHAMALRYRDFITVALIAKIPDGDDDAGFPDNWVYIHDPAVKVGRVQNFLSWSPELAPKGFACLGLEYFCFEGDGLWSASDEELVALAKREIGHIGLISPARVVDAEVVRQSKAYPIYDDAYQTHVDAVRDEFLTTFPSLHLVGRNGMHKYNNQDHAMMTAMLTVANILAGAPLYDVWQVNEDAEYGEAGASGVREALKSERLVPRRAA